MNLRCHDHDALTIEGDLRRDWLELLERLPAEQRIFGPEWIDVWNRTLGREGNFQGKLRVVTARAEDGRLEGLLPLSRCTMGPFRVLSMAGFWQPFRPLLAAEGRGLEVADAVAAHLLSSDWHILRMGPASRRDAALERLRELLFDGGTRARTQWSGELAVADVPGDWETYVEEILGRKNLKKIEYYERRAGRHGDVEVVHHREPTGEELDRLLANLCRVEENCWLYGRDSDLRFVTPTLRSFWKGVIESAFAEGGQFDSWVMYMDARPISFVFSLTSGPTRYVIANNYDEDYKDHRTGNILYRHMFEDGISRGVRRFDIGTGSLHYKKFWGAVGHDRLDDQLLFCPGLAGTALFTGLTLKDRAQGLAKRLRRVAAMLA